MIRKVGAQPTQPTKLEAVDDDPLGPLGSHAEPQIDEPPVPPQKEQIAPGRAQQATSTAASQGSLRSMMDSVNLEDDASVSSSLKQPPPVQPPVPQNGSGAFRQTQPSMSVLEAARPTFNIAVGDPHKVGDLTSSHTEYNVTTRVCQIGPSIMLRIASLTMDVLRQLRKPTAILPSQSPAVIKISYGYIRLFTTILPV